MPEEAKGSGKKWKRGSFVEPKRWLCGTRVTATKRASAYIGFFIFIARIQTLE